MHAVKPTFRLRNTLRLRPVFSSILYTTGWALLPSLLQQDKMQSSVRCSIHKMFKKQLFIALPWSAGKGGAKRHRKVLRDNIQGITKPAIRRLARRGGVKRISGLIYEETRGVLKVQFELIGLSPLYLIMLNLSLGIDFAVTACSWKMAAFCQAQYMQSCCIKQATPLIAVDQSLVFELQQQWHLMFCWWLFLNSK